MFIVIEKTPIELARKLVTTADHKTILLVVYQYGVDSILFYNVPKTIYIDCIDTDTNQALAKQLYTPELKQFIKTYKAGLQPIRGKFKVKVSFYLLLSVFLIALSMVGFGIYKSADYNYQQTHLVSNLQIGEELYGRWQTFKANGTVIRQGFTWVKIKAIDENKYQLALDENFKNNQEYTPPTKQGGLINYADKNHELVLNAEKERFKSVKEDIDFSVYYRKNSSLLQALLK